MCIRDRIRRIVAAVLVLLFGAACLWGYRVYSSREDTTMNQESRSSGFPVKLKGDAVQSARMMGSAFALLTDREFSLYNSKGSTVRSAVSYTHLDVYKRQGHCHDQPRFFPFHQG